MTIQTLTYTGMDGDAATTANTGYDTLVVTGGSLVFDDQWPTNGTACLRADGNTTSGGAYGLKNITSTDTLAFDLPVTPVTLPVGELYFLFFGNGSTRNLALATTETGVLRVRDAANGNAWTSPPGVLVAGSPCIISLVATRHASAGTFRVVVYEMDQRTVRADSGLQTGKNTGAQPFTVFRASAAKASTGALVSSWLCGEPRWDVAATALLPAFVPGQTMPRYTPTVAFDGAANVGNLPGVARTAYSGTVSGGKAQLNAAVYNNVDFNDLVIDCRPASTQVFNNVRVVMGAAPPADDGINAVVRALNGSAASVDIVFNDSEFHCRAQRLYDLFIGRNVSFNRCVFTGGVDQVRLASTGAAPFTSGITLNDCWVGLPALWYDATAGIVFPADVLTHNDGAQVTTTTGGFTANNCFFAGWVSPFCGTGTPGSGSETNPNSPLPAYIKTQAQMETWRTAFAAPTLASQSFDAQSRLVLPQGVGGSLAAVMINRENAHLDHCYLSGWNVPVNFSDAQVPTNPNVDIVHCRFWNDMGGGRALNTTAKGTALQGRSGRSYPGIPTSGADQNTWMDGSAVPVYLTP